MNVNLTWSFSASMWIPYNFSSGLINVIDWLYQGEGYFLHFSNSAPIQGLNTCWINVCCFACLFSIKNISTQVSTALNHELSLFWNITMGHKIMLRSIRLNRAFNCKWKINEGGLLSMCAYESWSFRWW